MVSKKIFITSVVVALAIGAGVTALLLNNSDTGQPTTSISQRTSSSTTAGGVSLDYSGQGLTSFPAAALNRTDVVSLDLSNNDLSGSLPAEIATLTSLEFLDVSNNNMTGIPAEIGQLKHLKVLNYANNQITGLPMELGNLAQLETLDLTTNPNISQQDAASISSKLPNASIKL